MNLQPVTLKGSYVKLEPLSLSHLEGLCAVGLESSLWTWIPQVVRTKEEMRAYVEEAQRLEAAGTALAFAIVSVPPPGQAPESRQSQQAGGKVIGSTRYGNISKPDRRLEIGWTWVGIPWQRTAVNTEAKYLLMKHAFEDLGALRVELKTDFLNEKSRKAIARIGAKEEGVLRSHIVCTDGRVRDTVYFSVIEGEWPGVKARLEERLAGGKAG